jgi:heme exporter protein A
MNKDDLLKVFNFPLFEKHISFNVYAGDIVVLYGQNGSGKTTLLKKIALSKNFPNKDIQILCNTAYLGHKFGIKMTQTVNDYLSFSLEIAHAPLTDIDYFLNRYQLNGNQKISNLSFGQIQKVGLIRILLSKKQLWILDEPFSNVDQKSQNLFLHDLEQHLSFQGAAIIATHDTIPITHESVCLS